MGFNFQAAPLCWPANQPRTEKPQRSNFDTILGLSCIHLDYEIQRLGGQNLIITADIPIRKDGWFYDWIERRRDNAIAVYFDYADRPRCMACDKWERPEDNIRAIEKTIDALRAIERWGSSDLMQQSITGFIAGSSTHKMTHWTEILEVSPDATKEHIDQAYQKLRRHTHPDYGGTPQEYDQVQKAWKKPCGNAFDLRGAAYSDSIL